MKLKLCENIKKFRLEKGLTQEELAEIFGVSAQAVSRWENGNCYPDLELIPAIASFFGVSTDELLGFNIYETNKSVEAIVDEYHKHYYTDKRLCEKILRDGLKKHPGNDILLNCLVGILPLPEKSDEVIKLCKGLIETTTYDEIRLDAYRVLAEAYKTVGEYTLMKETIEKIPEIYFTKLSIAAELFEGKDRFEPAIKQQKIAIEDAVKMSIIVSEYYIENKEYEKAKIHLTMAKDIIMATKHDFDTEYTKGTIECYSEQLKQIDDILKSI